MPTQSERAEMLRAQLDDDDLDELVAPPIPPREQDGRDWVDYPRNKPETKSLEIHRYSDLPDKTVNWLWKPYIPLGRVTICQGDPGLGKTYIATQIAAIITTGGAFPAGDNMKTQEHGTVIFQTAEDGLADTIKVRLMEAGADCAKVVYIDETQESLSFDDSRLKEAIRIVRPKLVIIDPLQAYIGASKDMHRANEIRPVMARLHNLAEEYDCAILLIGHQNKSNGGKSIYRGLGSIDIAAAARSVLAVGEVPNEKYRRAIVQIKSSLAPTGQTILFDLDPSQGFLWAGTSDLTADDVLNYHSPIEREAPAREEAEEFLNNILKDGRLRSKDVEAEARECGISIKTLRNAREKLGIVCSKGRGNDTAWYWELAHTKTHGQVSQYGHVVPQVAQEAHVDYVVACGQVDEIPRRGEI